MLMMIIIIVVIIIVIFTFIVTIVIVIAIVVASDPRPRRGEFVGVRRLVRWPGRLAGPTRAAGERAACC